MQNTVTTPILQANTSNFESIMNETTNQHFPKTYDAIAEETQRLGFTMPSDVQTCALLRTLSTSKPVGNFLELGRSEEHTSELQSLMRISYAVFCLKTKNQ